MLKKVVTVITGITLVLGLSMFLPANAASAKEVQEQTQEESVTEESQIEDEVQKEVKIKINKTNFPGLYQTLKDKKYDTDEDGYLSEYECRCVFWIQTPKAVSSLEGIENFPNLSTMYLANYTGTKITITKTNEKLKWLYITPKKSKLTINAPYVKRLGVQLIEFREDGTISMGNVRVGSTLKTLDISTCKNVQVLEIIQSKLSTLKLPNKNSNLQWVCLESLSIGKLDFQNYKNLAYLRLAKVSNLKSLNLSKNTNLRAMEIYSKTKLKKIDVSNSKKLSAIYLFQENDSLKKSIILPKGKTVKFPSTNESTRKIGMEYLNVE
ncbi:hypothetical protein [Anaerosporobacter sp.]|uniref:hypothetical protein n=1 Tax=Anaerosporobacter sp. TaxID=1872529 RepID=UPI00286F2127|nr:hypothetical protein [Anaerosporobacter sp.]